MQRERSSCKKMKKLGTVRKQKHYANRAVIHFANKSQLQVQTLNRSVNWRFLYTQQKCYQKRINKSLHLIFVCHAVSVWNHSHLRLFAPLLVFQPFKLSIISHYIFCKMYNLFNFFSRMLLPNRLNAIYIYNLIHKIFFFFFASIRLCNWNESWNVVNENNERNYDFTRWIAFHVKNSLHFFHIRN